MSIPLVPPVNVWPRHPEVGPVAVLGAGTMGRGIAQIAVQAGHEVRLADHDPAQLPAAQHAIDAGLDRDVARGRYTADGAEVARARLSLHTDLTAACAGARLVIETVVEDLGVKQAVLRAAEPAAAPDAVLATNTSARSVTAITGVLDDPTRGIGMHFFSPVPRMALCELVRAAHTSASTLERAEIAARSFGRTTVRVADVPGFATSRISALIGNEALRMVEDGVTGPEDVDTAVRLGLNHPMGPLELGDLVGWDVRLDVLEHLHAELGERYRPTQLHRRLLAAGRLGRKTGHGIYRYDADGRRLPGGSLPDADPGES